MTEDIMYVFARKAFENSTPIPMRVLTPEEREKHIRRDLEQIFLKDGYEGVAKAINRVWSPETHSFDRVAKNGIIVDDD